MTLSATTNLGPFGLKPRFSERIWGRASLAPWYGSTGTAELVGEAWLTGPACVVESGPMAGTTLAALAAEQPAALLGTDGGTEFPLLVKMLFPDEKLSVQVHPNDAQAAAMGQARGKTECWYVLDAAPGATVALGLRPGVSAADVAASVSDGTMEGLMQWLPVSAGDMVFVDAGTVHAIGPGVVLLETQQTCDVTFRMYDYGRPRELHLEQGLKVMQAETRAGKVAPVAMDGFTRLIAERYFTVDRFDLGALCETSIGMEGPGCLVGLAGSAEVVDSAGHATPLVVGEAVVLPVSSGAVRVRTEAGAAFARCFAPAA